MKKWLIVTQPNRFSGRDPAGPRAPRVHPAVVIGLDSSTGLQTARILAGHKIPVVAITKRPEHYCSRTGVCHQILVADTDSDELIETLQG